ncbi:hypothetical protein ALDI51_23270 [Alicycliphilus denitrificans]|uniref:phosphatase PAP2 family protein n=1 Tax=Alicycliphilus denitrificans TaxID=179636 RepID=UPI00095C0636|nr:phosphatase PAP2 family protein [Alicycliphilus denitrificans]OJW94622.1 MAG: phosphoesterase [Alicycliphilus sp. 69-12]BCN39008.1 hypothetical protein ALDI51_23270 [Alicycliphilus denitrificans]
MLFQTRRRLWILTLLLFSLLVLWDAAGLDLPLARLFGSAQGFAWRNQHTFMMLMHELPRYASGVLLAMLALGVFRPWGFLHRLTVAQRWQLVLSVAAGLLAVSALKRLSATSCPWDLAEFGGAAQYVSHWAWSLRDQGPGHCFPAGHASSAFAYVAGWFVLRRAAPGVAGAWLAAALLAGTVLGVAQQMRGAHYMSHTLWTAWVCWAVGLAVDMLAHARHHILAVDTKLSEAR